MSAVFGPRFRPRVLYTAYWGALEPLGRSLVVPAVKNLAARGAKITLLSFEKPADRAQTDAMRAMRRDLERAGVSWLALDYHHRPQAPATLFDIAQGTLAALGRRGFRRFDLVHGRTLVGGALGMILAPLLGAKLIFHNEGYWADERVDGGLWTPKAVPIASPKPSKIGFTTAPTPFFALPGLRKPNF